MTRKREIKSYQQQNNKKEKPGTNITKKKEKEKQIKDEN